MANTAKDFDELGITFTLNQKSIRSAYKKQALIKHPDKGGCNEEFKKLGNAFNKVQKLTQELAKKYPNLDKSESGSS